MSVESGDSNSTLDSFIRFSPRIAYPVCQNFIKRVYPNIVHEEDYQLNAQNTPILSSTLMNIYDTGGQIIVTFSLKIILSTIKYLHVTGQNVTLVKSKRASCILNLPANES